MQTILFFGNSLTAGYGLRNAAMESVPGLIQQKFDSDGIYVKIINAGLSGDTSRGGLVRVEGLLNQPIDVFVLELGINDIIRGIPPQTTLQNLQLIIEKVKAYNPKVRLVILGMEIPFFLRANFAEEFRSIFRQLAAANDMGFVPFLLKDVAGKKQFNLPDRLHPNAEGYKIIVENVWPVVRASVLRP